MILSLSLRGELEIVRRLVCVQLSLGFYYFSFFDLTKLEIDFDFIVNC